MPSHRIHVRSIRSKATPTKTRCFGFLGREFSLPATLFSNMHLYTAETDRRARGKWLNSINKIRELKPSVVIPGHSKVRAALDAGTAADFTQNYLLAFEEEITKAKDSESLTNAMKERFPSADFLLALDRGAKASVKS